MLGRRSRAASRETQRVGGSAVALVLTVFWVSCGGKRVEDGTSPTSGRGGQSAAGTGAVGGSHGGGVADGGGRDGAGAGGAQIPLTGGTSGNAGSSGASHGMEQAGAAGDPGDCDPNTLWQAVTRGAGATRCDLLDPPPDGDAVDQLHGAVVIDHEGRVVDNTGLTDAAKQEWLSELAGQRWMCLASTTLGYSCTPIRG